MCNECGGWFKGRRGLGIHLARSKCRQVLQRRTANAGESVEVNRQEINHRADDSNAAGPTERERKARIVWPRANSDAWRILDAELEAQLIVDENIGGNIEGKLQRFVEVCYKACARRFGVREAEQRREDRCVRKDRRQERFREEKKALRKRYRRASSAERRLLQPLWEDLKKRHAEYRKVWRCRERRKEARRARELFYKDPFRFVRKVLEEAKSGELRVPKEELEAHMTQTYSDHRRDEPVQELEGLVRPNPPEREFDIGELKFWEVQRVVRKARAASAPGQDGLSYKLFKYCPKVLKCLWHLLKTAWRRGVVMKEWCMAEGIWIPKEKESKEINQFRPISLLNVVGKVYLGVLARRLTEFVLANNYIDTSVQKAGIPGFPGCIEHAQMIWDTIKHVKGEKGTVDVVWLDLANAYGSVPHAFIRYSMEFFWVPQSVVAMVEQYYNQFVMRFTTRSYTTEWQELQTGIPMGCTISPLLFVLVMEIVTRSSQAEFVGVQGADGVVRPPLRSFMDDITVICSEPARTRRGIQKLSEMIRWLRMKFKASKCRSLSIRRGKVQDVRFQIAGEGMPTVREQPVKSLGRWYRIPLTDRSCGMEVQQTV